MKDRYPPFSAMPGRLRSIRCARSPAAWCAYESRGGSLELREYVVIEHNSMVQILQPLRHLSSIAVEKGQRVHNAIISA